VLALSFRGGEYAFVYHEGRPIGAIIAGDLNSAGEHPRRSIVFSGQRQDFEILRPNVVANRFGRQELERLIAVFLPS
jgi:hypothetical protein